MQTVYYVTNDNYTDPLFSDCFYPVELENAFYPVTHSGLDPIDIDKFYPIGL